MKMIKDYFDIRELVPKAVYDKLGSEACWALFPQSALDMLLAVREAFGGPLLANNWHRGGSRQYSGFRPANCRIGARLSAHKEAMAFDVRPLDGDVAALYDLCKTRHQELGITELEHEDFTPSWVHVSVRGDSFRIIRPRL